MNNTRYIYLALLSIFTWTATVQAEEFDSQYLAMLGISENVAEKFTKENHFPEGVTSVDISINGETAGTQQVKFDHQGQLCIDTTLLDALGLASKIQSTKNSCQSISDFIDNASVTLKPGTNEVELFVPQAALQKKAGPINYTKGGRAAIVNYNINSIRHSWSGGKSQWDGASIEAGINFNDWAIRSLHTLSRTDGKTEISNGWLYAQRVLEKQAMLMQVGQINTATPLVSGGPIEGVQLTPWSALSPRSTGIAVNGVALASPSHVEVRQSGILIYTTRLPGGPFSLTDVTILNKTSNLELTVTGPNGEKTVTTLTPAEYVTNQVGVSGFSASLGRLRQGVRTDNAQPWLITAGKGYALTPTTTLNVGGLFSTQYQNAATGLTFSPWDRLQITSELALSRDENMGMKTTFSAHYQPRQNLSLVASHTRSTSGYRDFTEVEQDRRSQSSTASINWQSLGLGNVSLGVTKAAYANNAYNNLNASWSKSFGFGDLSFLWQRQQRENTHQAFEPQENRFSLTLSLPFGKHRITNRLQSNGRDTTWNLQSSGALTPEKSYNLNVERSLNKEKNTTVSGSLSANMRYTTGSVSLGAGTNGRRQLSASLSGGIVAHENGVTFSPVPVTETFAIAKVEPGVSGVRIDTPQGPVWSDRWGQAVISGIDSYQPSRIELNTESLPNNIDVGNGFRQLTAGFASVSRINFQLLQTRQVLLKVTGENGKLLDKGVSITTPDGNYVTTSVDDGQVFISDISTTPNLIANGGGNKGNNCTLTWQLPEKAPENTLFETVSAQCH